VMDTRGILGWLAAENPARRLVRWLGWSEDDTLRVLGWGAILAAFAAGIYLSYNSLIALALKLGYSNYEAPAYPFAIDAMVAACYVGQLRTAGLVDFARRRAYLVVVGVVAALLTATGNALHGVLVYGLISDPLPWPLLVAGSIVPAFAMAGSGHAIMIIRSAERARQAIQPARLPDPEPEPPLPGREHQSEPPKYKPVRVDRPVPEVRRNQDAKPAPVAEEANAPVNGGGEKKTEDANSSDTAKFDARPSREFGGRAKEARAYIEGAIARGEMPSSRELAKALGVGKRQAQNYLRAFRENGGTSLKVVG
jgi:hypothetical protein